MAASNHYHVLRYIANNPLHFSWQRKGVEVKHAHAYDTERVRRSSKNPTYAAQGL